MFVFAQLTRLTICDLLSKKAVIYDIFSYHLYHYHTKYHTIPWYSFKSISPVPMGL